jgi:hypothetical protein
MCRGAAIKELARREGIKLKSQSANTLEKLLRMALERRYFLDAHFEVTASAAPSPHAGDQDYAQRLTEAFRGIGPLAGLLRSLRSVGNVLQVLGLKQIGVDEFGCDRDGGNGGLRFLRCQAAVLDDAAQRGPVFHLQSEGWE